MMHTAATYITIAALAYHKKSSRRDRTKQSNLSFVHFLFELTRTPKRTVLVKFVPLAHAMDARASTHTVTQYYWWVAGTQILDSRLNVC
jgi:hypothetical protein